jgi:ankyrin repeat protein
VKNGFDARATYTFPAGADGEAEPAEVSLVWFAVARAQNNRLARYFLEQGAAPGALFAAAWWGNADIVPDLVRHGADVNERVEGSTPLHMAVEVVQRGIADKPALARQRRALLERMLALGADPNLPNANGLTPLGIAAKKRHDAAIVDLLKKYGGR